MALGSEEVIDLIKDYTSDFDNVFVDFSGGKYSLVLLHLALRALREVQVVYVDTTITLPECNEYVEKLSNEWGFELIAIKREDTNFWEIVKKWGFPHARFRWCMKELKSIPLKLFNGSIGGNCLHMTGTTMSESTMRKKVYSIRGAYHFNYSNRSYTLHPILAWNKEMVNEYISKHSLPVNSCYSVYGKEGNCYYCPYMKKKEYYLKLAKVHPELFQNIVDAERDMKKGGAAIYLGRGEVLYLSELIQNSNHIKSDV